MIPKIIHQIWLGSKPCPSELIQSWKTMHPGWRHILWTEQNLFSLTNQAHFDACPSPVNKSDFLRFEVLHKYGGIYLDADSYCLRPMDDLLSHPSFTVYENVKAKLIANGTVALPPKSPLALSMLLHLSRLPIKSEYNWQEIGPTLWTRIISKHPEEPISILPSSTFYPYGYTDIFHVLKGAPPTIDISNSYSLQLWGSTRKIYPKIKSLTEQIVGHPL